MFKRIDTIFLPVSDTHASIKWYEEKCGFRLRWHDVENGYAALDIGNGETAFTLVNTDHFGNEKPADHEWFNFYTSDIHQTHQRLLDAGVEATPVQSGGKVEFFQFKDLDGNLLGVCSFEEDAA
ncbi:VOC family protein [Paenisporosarcina cavernae]|uniref:VOC family protein n=1 Tax=Paenisporosarcina cavernae TaxID=2320858 RepID=A0A385YY07_9BACL|nr:VOC family protein [Paenisporosarcina cavernae]AYC30423.1 VOC family protein [Paenisporosarcina cavernae]